MRSLIDTIEIIRIGSVEDAIDSLFAADREISI